MNVGIQDKISEAKQHFEVLEELRDEKSAWLNFYKEHGKRISYIETTENENEEPDVPWVDDDTLPNEDMIPDNEVIG